MPRGSDLKGLYLGALITFIGLLLSWAPYGLDVEERFGLTWLFWARGSRPTPPEVLIVAVDRRSARKSGLPEKPEQWSRALHGQFIQQLSNACARVVVYDMFFGDPRSPSDDQVLAQAIRNAANVVLVGHLGILEEEPTTSIPPANLQTTHFPIPVLAEAAAGVAPFPLPNVPQGVTGYWAFKTSAGDIPTLPVLTFQIYALNVYEDFRRLLTKLGPEQAAELPVNKEQVVASKGITDLVLHLRELFKTQPQLGKQMLAELDQASQHSLPPATTQTIKALIDLYQSDDWQYLNFYGPPRSITTINYREATRRAAASKPCDAQNIFSDKVVLVGMSETSPVEQKDKDIFDTVYSDPSGLKMSGVEIATTAVANLIDGTPLRRLVHLPSFAIIIAWGFLVAVLWRSYSTAIALWVTFALALSYYSTAFYFFKCSGMWFPIVVPLVQLLSGSTLAVARNRKDLERNIASIRLALTEWLPPNAIEQLVKSPDVVRQASGLVYGTCLHTDLAGFTSLAEGLDPVKLSVLMNDYFRIIAQPVTRHEGFVSDQTGDAMLAIWAAVKPDIRLQHLACAGALDICEALARLRRDREHPTLVTRIGLHTGRIAVGGLRIGTTQHHRSFGVIVNTAQRIQSLNKELRTRILASRDVVEGLSGFVARPVGTFVFAGLTLPLDIYEVLGRKAQQPSVVTKGDLNWLCGEFAEALDAYKDGQWQAGIDQLLEILDACPDDGPAQFYLRKCEFYKHHPPPGLWDPVIRQ